MANWEEISRNAKTHGDFAGRTHTEQDAYFEFFSGSEPGAAEAIVAKIRKIFTYVRILCTAGSLPRSQFRLGFFGSTSSN